MLFRSTLDLTALGYDKLLGGGKFKGAVRVKIERYSERARQKIEEFGGEVLPNN